MKISPEARCSGGELGARPRQGSMEADKTGAVPGRERCTQRTSGYQHRERRRYRPHSALGVWLFNLKYLSSKIRTGLTRFPRWYSMTSQSINKGREHYFQRIRLLFCRR